MHRLIEALKHMFAIRMNLGDPDFVNISKYEKLMLSHDFADQIRKRIFDNTTFPPDYYMNRYCPFIPSRYCLVILLRSLFQIFFFNHKWQVESAKRSWNKPFLHCR